MPLRERTDIRGEAFNIGNSEPVTMEELARRVIERSGSTSDIRYIPYDQAYGPGYEDMRHREPSLDKIREAIGYIPKTSLDEILDVVIADTRKRLQHDV